MRLIVGLGNIGKKYEQTRHNAGFFAVRWLAHEWESQSQWSEQRKLEAYIVRDQAHDAILAQPTTMMNESGRAVRKIMDYFNLSPSDVVIIHDDADLPIGEIRQTVSSQTGAGHHGVLSIIQHIGSGFERIRIGIGRPDQPVRDISSYVLSRLPQDELLALTGAFQEKLVTSLDDRN